MGLQILIVRKWKMALSINKSLKNTGVVEFSRSNCLNCYGRELQIADKRGKDQTDGGNISGPTNK